MTDPRRGEGLARLLVSRQTPVHTVAMIMHRDTHPEAERVLISVLRRQTAAQKLRILDKEFELAQSLMRAGIRLRRADANSKEIESEYFGLLLGHQLADRVLAFRRLRHAGSTTSLGENGPTTR